MELDAGEAIVAVAKLAESDEPAEGTERDEEVPEPDEEPSAEENE